jgi:hypothetical protein
MDDGEFSLNQFDEYLDGHFGEITLPKESYRWQDDAVERVETSARQKAARVGRKLVVAPRSAADPEVTLVRKDGQLEPYGYGHQWLWWRMLEATPRDPIRPSPA